MILLCADVRIASVFWFDFTSCVRIKCAGRYIVLIYICAQRSVYLRTHACYRYLRLRNTLETHCCPAIGQPSATEHVGLALRRMLRLSTDGTEELHMLGLRWEACNHHSQSCVCVHIQYFSFCVYTRRWCTRPHAPTNTHTHTHYPPTSRRDNNRTVMKYLPDPATWELAHSSTHARRTAAVSFMCGESFLLVFNSWKSTFNENFAQPDSSYSLIQLLHTDFRTSWHLVNKIHFYLNRGPATWRGSMRLSSGAMLQGDCKECECKQS